MRRTGGAFLIALVSLLGVRSAAAQDLTVRAYVDRTEVAVNGQFVLAVEIAGGNVQITSNPELPDLSSFAAYLGSGSSRQIQIVNGQTSVTATLEYRYQATAEGTFEIGPVRVEIAGKVYETDPLTIEVTRTAATPAPRAQPGQPSAGGDVIAPEDLFLRATIDKRSVYENEPVVVEYKIYTRVRVSSYSVTRTPNTAGFWAEEFPLPQSPETSVEVLDGRRYTVATIKKTALFPTGVGQRTIDPMTIETQVRVRTVSADPFEDFFRGGSLFGRSVAKLISSDPITVEVEPLPAAGQPPDFTGLVGRLNVTASADKSQAETNEPVTLLVHLSGLGNIRTLPQPDIEFPPDFEVYPPEVSEQIERDGNRITGTRTYEYVMVPRAPGVKSISPIRMSYFDPTSQTYRSLRTAPVTIEVTGDPVLAPITSARGRSAIQPLRADIRFIHTQAAQLRERDRSPLSGPLFWIAFLLPLASVGGALAFRRHRDRLEGDVAYARHRRASRIAKKRLAKARALKSVDTHREFYAEVANALHGFLGDKLNIAEAGLIRDDVQTLLKNRGAAESVIDDLFSCLDVCDRKRFSPTSTDREEMRSFLTRSATVMSALDRDLSK